MESILACLLGQSETPEAAAQKIARDLDLLDKKEDYLLRRLASEDARAAQHADLSGAPPLSPSVLDLRADRRPAEGRRGTQGGADAAAKGGRGARARAGCTGAARA